jgi:hypothetical protein
MASGHVVVLENEERSMYRLLGVTVALALLTGCAYERAVNNLSPEERNAFWAYRKVMRSLQEKTYLSKPDEAARSVYLRDIGVKQRFEALDAQDRESVLHGFIRQGMRAEALNFLWGEPEYTSGATGEWEYWLYRGYASDLFEHGNQYNEGSSRVRVFLVDNQVKWWTQEVPESEDDAGDSGWN